MNQTPARVRIPARMLLLIGALTAFGPLCIDMYLPALPTIGRELGASASEVQASLTACLIGIGVGQILIGPISDRLGRRPPLFAGLLVFIVASVGCGLAPNIGVLIALRLLQGLGGSAGLVIAKAVVRDLYLGTTAARFFSLLMVVTGAGPILAPQIGSGVLAIGSWRWVFGAFAVTGLILMTIAARGLPETLPPRSRHGGSLAVTFGGLGAIVTKRTFLVNALACGIAFGGLFAYIAGAPFVLENIYGLSPEQFAFAFALNAVGLIIGAQVNSRLVGRFKPFHLLTAGLIGFTFGGTGILVVVLTGWLGLWGVLIFAFISLGSNGFIGPNAQALAMNDFPHAAGSASAVLGVLQFVIGAAIAPLIGLGGSHNALPMAIAMASLAILALGVRLVLARPSRETTRARARVVPAVPVAPAVPPTL